MTGVTLRVSYVGEHVTSTGFALVGVRPYLPGLEAEAVWRAIMDARNCSDLVIIGHTHASTVQTRLDALIQSKPVPPIVIVPNVDDDGTVSDRAVDMAWRALGLN